MDVNELGGRSKGAQTCVLSDARTHIKKKGVRMSIFKGGRTRMDLRASVARMTASMVGRTGDGVVEVEWEMGSSRA
jgi:outer membrane protein TolC